MVDQFTKRVGTVQRLSWYLIGSYPSIEMANSWDKVTALGAVTNDGESFYCWTEDSLKTQHGLWLLKALQEEFGEDLVVFLDRASYFYTRDLWEYVSGERAKLSPTISVACAESSSKSGTFHRNYRNSTL